MQQITSKNKKLRILNWKRVFALGNYCFFNLQSVFFVLLFYY